MKVKILGIQTQEYKLENGYHFKGRKLHLMCLDEKPGLCGCEVDTVRLSDDSPLSNVHLTIGSEYNFYFDQRAHLDAIIPIES